MPADNLPLPRVAPCVRGPLSPLPPCREKYASPSPSLKSSSPPRPHTYPQAHAEITVQDDFVDESAIAQLRGQFPAASERFLEFINVPRSLYERMAGLVAPNERKALAAAAATATSVQLPAHRALLSGKKGVAEHKDGYLDASAVEQNVGLLYLKGDGVVRFTHEATGEQTHVDVKPGRFLTWDNMAYTHTVFPGQETREMLGPMTFKDTHAHMSGFCDPGVLQAWADRLLVKPGSLLKIYLEMIFDELPSDCDWKRRHLEETRGLGSSNPTANICLTKTNGVDRRMLNTFKRSTSETTFTKSSVFPNTWKVSQGPQELGGANNGRTCRTHPSFFFSSSVYPHSTAQGPGRDDKRRRHPEV